ncbi:MAG: hypothetical protein WC223_00090 [Bacteroidales bacterium]|jgi:hypothetical protein
MTKKILSILFALLIVISVLHISFAVHFCCEELVAVKISFEGRKASCGMESSAKTCPSHNSISSICCSDKIFVYTVENNYIPASLQIQENINQILLNFLCIPLRFEYNNSYGNNSPPGSLLTSAVKLSDICVFRL